MESDLDRSGQGGKLSPSVGRTDRPADSGGGDGRDGGGGKERAQPQSGRLPEWVLPGDAGDASGEAGVAGTAGSAGTVPDGSIRAVSAERESAGGGAGRDVHPGGIDAQGQRDYRAVVR